VLEGEEKKLREKEEERPKTSKKFMFGNWGKGKKNLIEEKAF